ncbi:intradiol ring-cleavage dioxygenase, partial [Roseomonas sp. 18066]|uniref:intradiol ring-cleavage dioxygenase n=1 Tax=Roseomonas sp. 18066 TaxID=2681412 RepID=UPI00190F6ED1
MSFPSLPRRHALAGLALGAASLGARAAEAATLPEGACRLTPQSVEGPYYLDPDLVRRAITEGRPGIPLELRLTVLGADCRPLPGARVDLWHADAAGLYSGYAGQGDDGRVSTVGQKFLRGVQTTDAAGQVGFDTLYPGWYRGRTTHAHVKVFLDRRTVLNGQVYFPDALSEFLYRHIPPYSARTARRDTINRSDGILRMAGAEGSFCAIAETERGYLASLTIAVSPEAVVSAGPGGPPGGGPPGPGA